MNVTVRQLQAFVTVAQLSGFSAAALRLHLTQSALSMLVRSLEEEIGVKLLERTTRSVKLTDAGRDFLPEAEKMLTDLHKAVAVTRLHADLGRSRLVIAVSTTFASTLLPELLETYQRQNPDVFVLLRDDATRVQIRQLVLDGDADVGIGPLERSERAGLVVDVLMTDELMLACPAGHELAEHERVTWRDLADARLIGFARDTSLQQLIEQSLADTEIRLRPKYEVVSIATATALVAQGLGVAILPSYAQRIGASAEIQYRPLVNPIVTRDLCLLRLRDRAIAPAAQNFVDIVLNAAPFSAETRLSKNA